MPASPPKLRILFFAEAVTLAHVARPVTLANALDPAQFDVHLAWDDRYKKLFPDLPPSAHAINSIPTAQFTRALAKGTPIYRISELRNYIERDLEVIRDVKPDVIVGDFRLSLAISAPVAGVPHLALANAYWSPYARTRYPLPDHPIRTLFGATLGGILFNLARPFVFAQYAAPINRLRTERGLPKLGELRTVYTHGDQTLYCDIPEMAELDPLPANHHFIGPVLWSPRIAPPAWWDKLPADRPIIYVNLGSSGNAGLLPVILEALSSVDATVIAATAGSKTDPRQAGGYVSDYLPGDLACERAALVICNGGSPATQQALAAGKPVIGVPTNLDQCLNMQAITRLGAGTVVRTSRRFKDDIRAAARRLIGDDNAINQAKKLADGMARYDAGKLLAERLKSADKR